VSGSPDAPGSRRAAGPAPSAGTTAAPGAALVSGAALLGLARRPDLWLTAAAVGLRTAEPGWWRRWPPWPRPARAYQELRQHTMFATGGPSTLDAAQLVGYLEWCQRIARHPR
jgi:hypothetical protein